MKKLVVLLTISMMCVASASAVSVYDWDGTTAWSRTNGALGSGNIFTVNEDVTVYKLGSYNWYYGNVTPTDADYPIELYEVTSITDTGSTIWSQRISSGTGTLLATVNIGTGPDVEENIGAGQYVTLATPVQLTAGKTYALYMDDNGARTYHAISDYIDTVGSGVNIASEITHLVDFFSYNTGGTLLDGNPGMRVGHVTSPDGTYWVGGPDMVIPEPATICLLGIGALSLIRRKRA